MAVEERRHLRPQMKCQSQGEAARATIRSEICSRRCDPVEGDAAAHGPAVRPGAHSPDGGRSIAPACRSPARWRRAALTPAHRAKGTDRRSAPGRGRRSPACYARWWSGNSAGNPARSDSNRCRGPQICRCRHGAAPRTGRRHGHGRRWKDSHAGRDRSGTRARPRAARRPAAPRPAVPHPAGGRGRHRGRDAGRSAGRAAGDGWLAVTALGKAPKRRLRKSGAAAGHQPHRADQATGGGEKRCGPALPVRRIQRESHRRHPCRPGAGRGPGNRVRRPRHRPCGR